MFSVTMQQYNAGQKKRNSELGIFCGPPEGGGTILNIVLIQGAHKNLMTQSCVSFDQHCTSQLKTGFLDLYTD